MKCERCKFENIPGQSTCIKCGSVLQITSSAANIYPPRMPRWKKPFRYFSRLIRKNRVSIYIHAKLHTPQWLRELLSDMTIGVFLCLIPGLGHLINKRFKEIRWYFLAWLVLLLTGLFLYGSSIGSICIGLAIGLHVGIAILYGLFKDLDNFREKAAVAFFLLIGMIFLYRYIPRILTPFTGSFSTMAIPHYNISEGDYLLAHSNIDSKSVLARGSLVVVRPVTVGGYQNVATRNEETIIAEIIGLPEENIQISEGVFLIDNQPLNTEQYPVPGWLRNRTYSDIIPKDSYFVSARYNITAHGNVQLTNLNIRQVCIVKKNAIEAKAFMRWLPLAKRGFLP